jgi:hypothetical protein
VTVLIGGILRPSRVTARRPVRAAGRGRRSRASASTGESGGRGVRHETPGSRPNRQRGVCRGACSQSLAKHPRCPASGWRLLLGEGESEVDLVVSSTRIGKVRQRRISRPPCSWRIRGLLDRGPRALPSCWRSIFLPTAFAWLPTSDVSSATLAACRQRRRYLARRPTMRVAGNSWLPPSRRLQQCRR